MKKVENQDYLYAVKKTYTSYIKTPGLAQNATYIEFSWRINIDFKFKPMENW